MHEKLTVGNLIGMLEKVDRKAVIVVERELATGIVEVGGRIKEGYGVDTFVTNIAEHKHRDKSIQFTKWTEISTGEMVELPV